MRMTLALALSATLMACKDGETPNDDTAAAIADTAAGRATVSGTLSWTVDMDEDAEAVGYEDCSFTTTYSGVEDHSAPWMCQDCELIFSVEVQADDPDHCFRSVSNTDSLPYSWLAYKNDTWYYAADDFLYEMGPASFDGETLNLMEGSVGYQLFQGEGILAGSGQLSVGADNGDLMNGWAESDTYSCGWPKTDPVAYEGDYVLAEGGTLPDGLFQDACGDTVRLHNLAKGRYTILEMAALDCGPCEQFAQSEEKFVEDMAAKGIEVTVITMMSASVDAPGETPSQEQLQDWISTYSLNNPVLADRRWAMTVFRDQPDLGFPYLALMDPDLKVMRTLAGFSSTVFPGAARLIEQDLNN